jgi:MFS family permease
MLAARIATGLARRGIHYGWVMVGVTFLTMLATAAAMGLPGVLMVPLRQEFGFETAAISGAMALRLVLFGAIGPFAAALMSAYGLRASICAALALIAAGLALATRIDALWELYVAWGVMVGVGTGMTAIVLGATVATRWFTARRGLVLGLLTAAAATGQLIFLPAAAWAAETYGWRAGVIAPMAACLLAFLAMLLFGRDHPGELGLAPYGDPSPPGPAPRRDGRGAVRLAFESLEGAAQTRSFWILVVSFAICGFTTNGLVQTHFIPLCQDFGMEAVQAAGVLAIMGAFDFVGSIGSGYLSDRFDPRRLLVLYFGLRALALLALPYSDFTLVGLTLFAVFYGLDWIATVPPIVKLTAQNFGRDQAALVFGWIFAAHQAGAALAALGAGVVHDQLGDYLPAFTLGGILCIIAAIGVLGIRRGRTA